MNADAMRIFLFLCVTLISTTSLCAKSWHGIEPLRSTRSDVIRLLNQCSDQREACVFTFGDEDIYVLFFSGLTAEDTQCTERPPLETVMFIERRPHSAAALQDFQFAKREFTRSSLGARWHLKLRRRVKFDIYVNERDGLALKTQETRVVQAVYLPSSSEIGRCRSYYDPLESFVELWYGHVPSASVVCPQATVFEGQEITMEAHTDIPSRTGFKWTVSDGEIVAGQYTPRIRIHTGGLAGKSIKALVEVNDRDLGMVVWSECSIAVSRRP
jgi:hypothetical protein